MFARNNPHLIPAIIMAFALGALNPVWSQSISRDVTAAGGDFQQHPAFGSLHWTLGNPHSKSAAAQSGIPNASLQAKVSELDALRAEVADIKAMLLEKK